MSMNAEASRPADEVAGAPGRAVHLPLPTIVRILVTAFALWALSKRATVIALVLVAVVLTITFEPSVAWLERRRVPRWVGAALTVGIVVGLLLVFIALCGSSLVSQGRQVIDRLSSVQHDLAARLPGPLARVVRGGG